MAQLLSNFSQEFEPHPTFVDPVAKLRVSQPENLIDTDFEYGLQSTKWETLELSNNVPSYYVSDSDLPLDIVQSVQATQNSDVITVTCREPHGLVAGTPIDVRGLTSRTAEGKFLIKSVPDDITFTYVGNAQELLTVDIGSVYATITPGQFYSGSQIPYDIGAGIQTDGASPSTLTVNTEATHGFKPGAAFYLINSIGTKSVVVQPEDETTETLADIAPDGRPYVDTSSTALSTITPNLALTETKEMRSTHYLKFDAEAVDTATNYITWNNHGLCENDCLLYVPPSGDDQIGGLQRFYVYYVDYVNDNTIRLKNSFNGSIMNLTSEGTYNYGRAGLHMCYEIYYMNKDYRSYRSYYYTTSNQRGYRNRDRTFNYSGWDLRYYGDYGLGGEYPDEMMRFSRNGYSVTTNFMSEYFSSGRNSNMRMPESSNTPGAYNFIEDFQRYRGSSVTDPNNWSISYNSNRTFRLDNGYDSYYWSSYGYGPGYNRLYIMMMKNDEEADTFYAAGADINNGSSITLQTTGTGITVNTHTSTSWFTTETTQVYTDGNHTAERVSTDRFKIRFGGSSSRTRIKQISGTVALEAEVANPLAETFYVKNHGFATNDRVRIEVTGGGVLPTTETGGITLDTRLQVGNLRSAWNIFTDTMDTYTNGLTGHQDMILNGSESGNRYVNSGVASGSSLLNYADHGSTPYLRSYYIDNRTDRPNNALYNNQWSSTVVKDAGEGTPLANKGFGYIGTEYTQNISVPHYSVAYGFANPNYQDTIEFRLYNRVNASQVSRHTQNNQSYNINGDSGWRASYGARFDTDAGAAGYCELHLVVYNESWNGTATHPTYYISNGGNGSNNYVYNTNSNSSYWSKPLMFRTMFMLAPGTSFSSTDVDGLATTLINAIANEFVYPSISDGQDVLINVVNNDRISLASTAGIGYDWTSSGTFPFTLTQDGVVGTNDGTYRISSVPQSNQFTLELPFLSQPSVVTFDTASVDTTTNLVTTETEHFFAPGTRITYLQGSGSSGMAELSSGTEYYLYVQDEFNVGFAESYQDAIDGVLIALNPSSGIDQLQYDIVNGRVSGQGTVSTISGEKTVTGDVDSLFKRYFKVGDTIGIKDNNTNPGRIDEYTIAAIADDQTMELEEVATATTTGTKYFLSTKLYARPDGYAVHRPFDGGVEIAAGTSPASQICRQTRKYFRYQSGKGIQTSLAINFNPPVQFETLEAGFRDFIDPGTQEYAITTNAPDLNFDVSAPDAGAYLIDEEMNPSLTLIRGYTYTFTLAAPGHPFWIQTTTGSGYDAANVYNGAEVVGNGLETGQLTITPDASTPAQLYYQCQNHLIMNGSISVIDDPGTPLAYDVNGVTSDGITLVRGQEYSFTVDADGYPMHFSISSTYDEFSTYEEGVANAGADVGTISWTVPATAPSTLYYVSEANDVAGGTISIVNPTVQQTRIARGTTRYPHRLNENSSITVGGASDNTYNGNIEISSIIDEFTFEYDLDSEPATTIPSGFIQYNLNGYSGAYTRAGMFDFQNGFFFEFDGRTLYCVRRSSTQQLSGTVHTFNNSNIVQGNNTNFEGQLAVGDYVVLRGGSYRVTEIRSRDEMVIQPQYKGVSADNIIATKTVDTRVPQDQWSLDVCDGTGPTGYNLDLNKIQMCYMDYSWYGAGKIRFGFKDTHGEVRYVHEFIHNNILDEAYMRSGNLPAKYEIQNEDTVTYAPTLFHWGTSVIMDGTFDADDSYLFTAASKSLSFTNGQSLNATTNGNSQLEFFYNFSKRNYDWYVRIPFGSADASKFSSGTSLFTDDGSLEGDEVSYTQFASGNINVYLYITTSRRAPAVYPTVSNGTIVYIGAPNTGGGETTVNLGQDRIPLLTIRLAPSVDSNLTGALGAREIINRMQLKLQEVGLILSHDCNVSLVLNGDLSSVNYEDVAAPSLSQLIRHNSGEKVVGGTELFSFRASGGSIDTNTGKRLSNATNFDLDTVIDMGNSILGGDGTFPNGPDILTVVVQLTDTQGIDAGTPFVASSRITWSESQA